MTARRWALLLIFIPILGLLAVQLVDNQPAQAQTNPGLIVYSSNRSGNYEIYALDPTTGKTGQLTGDPANDVEPALSPDGGWIVFASNRDGDYDLYLMRIDGSGLRALTANNGEDRQPHWLDSGHVLYAANVKGQWDLVRDDTRRRRDPATDRRRGAGD